MYLNVPEAEISFKSGKLVLFDKEKEQINGRWIFTKAEKLSKKLHVFRWGFK